MKWVLRTTSVRVSDAQGDRVYESLENAPPELRAKVAESVNGPDSQTILIANQKAYDKIADGGDDVPADLRRLKPALLRHRASLEIPRLVAADGGWKKLLGGGVIFIVLFWAVWLWAIRSGT
jgi:hypothetical protein